MNISLAVIVFCGPAALVCLIIGIYGIGRTNQMIEEEKPAHRIEANMLGTITFLVAALFFTALTVGAVFA